MYPYCLICKLEIWSMNRKPHKVYFASIGVLTLQLPNTLFWLQIRKIHFSITLHRPMGHGFRFLLPLFLYYPPLNRNKFKMLACTTYDLWGWNSYIEMTKISSIWDLDFLKKMVIENTGAWGMNFVSSSPLFSTTPLFSNFSYKSFLFQNFHNHSFFLHLTISVDVIHHE